MKLVSLVWKEERGRPAQELSLRLALVDFDGKQALEALHTSSPIDEQKCF